MKVNLTSSLLHRLFTYDRQAGRLRWRYNGKLAGTIDRNINRYVITIGEVRFFHYHLVWLYKTAHWPTQQIDHINGNSSDDRYENLRDVSHKENRENSRRPYSNNQAGFLGVRKHGKRFTAQLCVSGKSKYLGMFDTPELAHQAYLTAKRELHNGCTL